MRLRTGLSMLTYWTASQRFGFGSKCLLCSYGLSRREFYGYEGHEARHPVSFA